MTVLETPRLILRPWTEDDAAAMHVIFSDQQAMRFWNTPLSSSVDDLASRIRYSRSAPPEVHAAWALILKETDQAIGFLNYHHRDLQSERLEIGYILAPEFWGRGLATEAISAWLDHCFSTMQVNRVEALIDPENQASIRLAQRLRFRQESGPMRQRLKMPDGRYADILMFGLLAADWRGRDAANQPMPVTERRPFYHDGMRTLQDRFDGRRVADRLAQHRRRYDFWDDDRIMIENTPFFFIATSFANYTDCSMRSGVPGFVKIVAPGTIEFPEYDGNSMYRTLGNISRNPSVGLLFVKFDGKTVRIRINGHATILDDAEALARHHGAKLVVRVECELFSNCPRAVHDLAAGTLSPYLPRPGYKPPAPEWKSRDYIRDILPINDPHRAGWD